MNLKQYKDPEEILEGRNAHGYVLKAGFTIVWIATCFGKLLSLPFTLSALQLARRAWRELHADFALV